MPKQRQTKIILLLAAAIALLVVGLLLISATQPRLVIDLDGQRIPLRGRFATVGHALEAAGLDLRDQDAVWPGIDAGLPDSGVITIRSAAPVALTLADQQETRWTQQDNLASFLAEQKIALKPSSTVYLDGRQVPWPSTAQDLAATRLGESVEISGQAAVQIDDSQDTIALETTASTVGQALIEAGIQVYAADDVEPPLNSRLHPGQRIAVDRATPVTVELGESELRTRTSRQDVAAALAELGVGLTGADETSPGLAQSLEGADEIAVRRANTIYEIVDSPLPFSSRMTPLDTLEIDQRALVSAGSPGVLSQLKRVDIVGTEVISQAVIGEWVSQPPTDEVIGYGTNIVVRSLDTPEGAISYWRVVRMRVTAYTAADAGKPPDHPAYGITASGRPAGFGVVAIDPKVVPFRSQVYVPGYGIAFAGDTGGGVKGRFIDLGYDEGEIVAWNGYVDVYYLTPVPDAADINYLIPTTLP